MSLIWNSIEFQTRLTNVPEATPHSPGRMFPLEECRQYRGVFDAPYLMDKLDPDVGVLFRLPLRTREQAIETERRISAEVRDKDAVKRLLQNFMEEDASECLLFLKNVRKVMASVIDDQGNLVEIGRSEARIDRQAEADLVGLRGYLKMATDLMGIADVEPRLISYELRMESKIREGKKKQLWRIVQQVGFEDRADSFSNSLWKSIDDDIIGKIVYLYTSGNLHILTVFIRMYEGRLSDSLSC